MRDATTVGLFLQHYLGYPTGQESKCVAMISVRHRVARTYAIDVLHQWKSMQNATEMKAAEELKIVLESHGGIQNTRVFTSDVEFYKQTLTKCSIPNINQLNNFIEENGMWMWLAYNIGEWRLIMYQGLNRISNAKQEEMDLKVRNSLSKILSIRFCLIWKLYVCPR